jgi:uracil phosphoribosyltransferase
MDTMKRLLVTTLRNKSTSCKDFRQAADTLAFLLAQEAANYIPVVKTECKTPFGATDGISFDSSKLMLVPILRSGLALLPAFLKYYPQSRVGVVGLKRDEQTAIAQLYYKNIPKVTADDFVIVLDPMIATGGSAVDALKMLGDMGVPQERMLFVGIISAQPGIDTIKKHFPKLSIITATHDKELNDAKFIVPGLGDFGDRYFGTEDGTIAEIKKLDTKGTK